MELSSFFFLFFPFPFFFYSSCALPVPVRAAGNCYRQIECLPVSVSGSFADSMNHAKEGSGKRRREQENDQFSRALALSLIWSGSLGFNSMSQSGLETHTFVITFQEEGAGRCEFSGVIKKGRPEIISCSRSSLALTLHSMPDTWMLSVKIYHYLLLHRSDWGQRQVGRGFDPAWPCCHSLGQGGPWMDQNLLAPCRIALWVQVRTDLSDHGSAFGSAMCSSGGNRGCICTCLKRQATSWLPL